MKNARYIILVLAVVVVALVGLMKTKNNISVTNPVDLTTDFCYIWNTESGDSASLKVTINDEDQTNISGSLNILPAEKDKKTGIFVGTVTPVDPVSVTRTATLMWSSSAEGIANTEELFIIFGEGIASVGFGEMKDRGDGVYIYADPKAISYTFNLQQTDCNDLALKY